MGIWFIIWFMGQNLGTAKRQNLPRSSVGRNFRFYVFIRALGETNEYIFTNKYIFCFSIFTRRKDMKLNISQGFNSACL
jgi:hypothetical protein